jgi:ribosomal protein S12 methylthiotransferase accessory factor
MADRIAVVGRGLLATAISEALSAGRYDDVADLPDGYLLVTATDAWDTRPYERIQARRLASRMSWLPVHVELGRAVVGPLHTPGVPGCVTCAELRRSLADEQFAVRESVRERYPRLANQPSAWLTPATATTVAVLTADEVHGVGRTRNALLYVDLDTLAVDTHRFLPDPLCPVCGGLPADSPDTARIVLRPRPKPTPDRHRVREADLDALRTTYVDAETGLVQRADTFPSGSLAVGAAAMTTRWHARSELSWGRTLRYRTSETVAVLEALERYGGMAPGGRRTVVRASFAEIRDTALDPRTLGLYPPERYARPGFPFQPFDVDRECRWVWGFSFARDAPVLVPQRYAYYRAHVTEPDDPAFAYEISNGCALGGCLEEAILYGILEVVERDAFLMTWYARLPVPRIDLSSARDRSVPMLARAIELETGYRVLAFDTTVEHGIPSVWAMAVAPTGTGQPALACAAGAHLDPEHAAGGALRELGPILADLRARYPDIADHARTLAGDPEQVVAMDDHSVLYTRPEAASRLDFLTAGTSSRTFADLRSRHGTDAFRNADLTDDLAEVQRRLCAPGLDVVVVDQTTPEHRAGGYHCVKVIVPGLLPMTFGHANRRVDGLLRLFEVPRLLGYGERGPQDINSHPHPFP